MYEVEQKFPVSDASAMLGRLRELGAREGGTVEQVDAYFNHPARDFRTTDEALRLRRVGETNRITYKGPKLDAATKTRREIELPLADGAAALAEFSQLLVALGFVSVREVRKTRRTLHLTWHERAVEIALDDVSGLGTFVELETSADENDLQLARECIASLAAALELTTSERRSYLEMLEENDKR